MAWGSLSGQVGDVPVFGVAVPSLLALMVARTMSVCRVILYVTSSLNVLNNWSVHFACLVMQAMTFWKLWPSSANMFFVLF